MREKVSEKELKEVLQRHDKWIQDSKFGERANLRYTDLWDANLRHADLRYADLQHADLRHADLWGAKLQGANLRNADLRNANLRNADLWYAELQGANMHGANIDFSLWPLWCGSLDVKVDARIARQLAYHFCRLDCEEEEYLRTRVALADFANGFHRVDECGRIEE